MASHGRHVDAADAARNLSPRDRDALASHTCDLCGAALLLVEIGPHYRERHPDDAPRVTARKAG